MKLPSSSLSATKTSSSSSTDSALVLEELHKGIRWGGKRAQTIEEGDQLLPSALGAQGEGDSGEASDCIETEDDIVVLGISSAGSWEGRRAACVRGGVCVLRTLSSSMSTAMG